MTHTHDTLMALATYFGATSLRVGSYERKDIYENSSVASYKTVDLRKEREIARAALSTAIAELVAERDALAKDAARYRFINDLCSQVGRDSEKIVRLVGNHQHLDALIVDEHIANASKMMKGTPT